LICASKTSNSTDLQPALDRGRGSAAYFEVDYGC
jgi:hypothetical protein